MARIYLVEDTLVGIKKLVRANNQAQALRHVVGGRFEVSFAEQEAIVDLVGTGHSVEDATVEVEPASVTGLVAA